MLKKHKAIYKRAVRKHETKNASRWCICPIVFEQKTDEFQFVVYGTQTVCKWRSICSLFGPHLHTFGMRTIHEHMAHKCVLGLRQKFHANFVKFFHRKMEIELRRKAEEKEQEKQLLEVGSSNNYYEVRLTAVVFFIDLIC